MTRKGRRDLRVKPVAYGLEQVASCHGNNRWRKDTKDSEDAIEFVVALDTPIDRRRIWFDNREGKNEKSSKQLCTMERKATLRWAKVPSALDIMRCK